MVLSRTGECAAVVLVSEISWENGDEREIGVWSYRPTVIWVNECEISPVEGGGWRDVFIVVGQYSPSTVLYMK